MELGAAVCNPLAPRAFPAVPTPSTVPPAGGTPVLPRWGALARGGLGSAEMGILCLALLWEHNPLTHPGKARLWELPLKNLFISL